MVVCLFGIFRSNEDYDHRLSPALCCGLAAEMVDRGYSGRLHRFYRDYQAGNITVVYDLVYPVGCPFAAYQMAHDPGYRCIPWVPSPIRPILIYRRLQSARAHSHELVGYCAFGTRRFLGIFSLKIVL